jgi:hypothetical protein
MEFKHKVYRCEWQVQCGTIDQYGNNFTPYQSNPFPCREDALAFLPLVADESQFIKDRWIPKNAPHSYCEARINYQEVLLET